jgi:putative endonuclease
MNNWFVYVLRCGDDSLYTGVTTDVERRVKEHNQDDKLAASYTRGRRPVKLVYQEACSDRSQALKREMGIKRLKRRQKEALIATHTV